MLHSISAHVLAWLGAAALSLHAASSRTFHVERRYCVYAALLTAACFTYTAALSAIYSPTNSTEFWKFAGLFLGPTLVALGWVVTNEVNIRNSRKQHTVTLIMQYFTNAKRIEDKDTLNKELPYPTVIDAKQFDFDNTKDELLRAVARELNYFDYLSSAVINREIDEQLLKRVFGTVIRHYCVQLRPYIDHWRAKDAAYWEDLLTLEQRWARAAPLRTGSVSPDIEKTAASDAHTRNPHT